jgi:hypothetical protein
MNTKFALVIPYFGKWPEWMSLYLYSLARNPELQVLCFSDIPLTIEFPLNFHLYRTSFKDYCERVSDTLHIQFAPEEPRKLCDVRPFYGLIHQEELKSYDFWGFGDIDLVYGDLSHFLSDKFFENYDFISADHDRCSGHFFLMRNTKENNELGFFVKDLYDILIRKGSHVMALDENRLMDVLAPYFTKVVRFRKPILNFPSPSVRINRRMYDCLVYFFQLLYGFKKRKMYFKERYTTLFKARGISMHYLYRNSKIIDLDVNRELMYLHFLGYKKELWKGNEPNFHIDIAKLNNHDLLIDDKGFHFLEV